MSKRFAGAAHAIRATALASVALGCLVPTSARAQLAPAPLAGPLPLSSTAGPAPLPGTSPSSTTAERPLYAYSGTIDPLYGNINAFYGNINAFYGNINAFYGNINAFSGDVSPFYGNINAFWGNINPFYGNINAFWGNINAFYGNINAFATSGTTIDGYVKPAWGNINAFWGQVGPTWGNINAFWGNINAFGATAPGDYATLARQIRGMVDSSRIFWGAAVKSQTGKSFDEAFAQPILAKWGVDLDNPASLANLSEAGRQRFMLDYYDQLMNYSGTDHVDWWMKGVNWTPALTTALGSGTRTTIGILDFSIVGDAGLTDNIKKFDGISTFSNGHGTAVASLIVSPQDGKGVMGIAPMAQVIAYNPFDSSGTANWTDVTKGVLMLVKNGASVINMSLGVPGWTFHGGWNDVFTNPEVQKTKSTALFVIAAGNDGVSQTQNVVWNKDNPNFVLVGSVDPAGKISSFSNQPGTACLVDVGGKCDPKNALMNRFIVAPGEMILVSDGQGGVTRMSGTSFAAPLVSGAVALIHNRWPWLQKDPTTTMRILLGSARDLGAPGVDPVYGVGELDVAQAVAPLDASKLQWYKPGPSGTIVGVDARTMTQATDAQKAKWEADGVYYYLYEQINGTPLLSVSGNTAYRDFGVPLSTKLFGQSVKSLDGSQQQLSDYLYSVYVASSGGTSGFAASRLAFGFSSFSERGGIIGGGNEGYSLTMSLAPKRRLYGYKQSTAPYQTALRITAPNDRASLRFGFGDGAVALGGQRGLAMISDYDVDAGGANPLLGMASGGAYANVDVKVAPGLRVAMGYSERQLHRDPRTMALNDLATINALPDDTKRAMNVAIFYAPTGRLTLNAALTQLDENNAVLGVRSIDPADFARGAQSDGVTLGADYDVGRGFGIAVSATQGRTTDRGSGYRNLSIGDGGFRTSAFELALSKSHLIDRHDQVRLAVSQPMHVDRGSLDFTSIQVIDRQTGELGVVTQAVALPGQARQLVGEMLYSRSLLGGAAGVSLFGRAQLRPSAASDQTAAAMGGLRMNLSF